MAYEPTKNFRQIVRELKTGDTVIAVGSYKKNSINLEKIRVVSLSSCDHQTTSTLHRVQQANDQRWERKGMEVQKVRGTCERTGGTGSSPHTETRMVRSAPDCPKAPGKTVVSRRTGLLKLRLAP